MCEACDATDKEIRRVVNLQKDIAVHKSSLRRQLDSVTSRLREVIANDVAVDRELKRLRKWKAKVASHGEPSRNAYYKAYYRENRERILAKAKQRNLSRRVARSATKN